jgi:DNA-directed RNA polymerase specialized sigma24 family protein
MDQRPQLQHADAVLLDFLRARDEAESQQLLDRLITEYAAPVIQQIVRYKLRIYPAQQALAEADDLRNDAITELIAELRKRKKSSSENVIHNFRGFTATLAYRTCHDFLRRRRPLRHSLKNSVRYALNAHPDLAWWEDRSGESACGFAVWQTAGTSLARNPALERLLADPHLLKEPNVPVSEHRKIIRPELLAAIFNFVGGPIELDDLVNVIATRYNLHEGAESLDALDAEGRSAHERLPDPHADTEHGAVLRDYLRHVWEEICQLPVQQRLALLLNLKDEKGNCLTAMLPVANIATIRQIADVLELPPEEFFRLWGDLPLEDARIADLLGLTRQQVINLRKSARQRLARRMKERGK